AIGGFNYTNPEWAKQALKEAGGFDIVIDSAGGPQFSQLFDLMMPGGRIAIYGRTAGNIPDVPTRLLYWKQISIHGTTMGTRDEFLSMLDLLESRNLKPVIDQVYPLEQIETAFQRMKSANQFGKIVLKIM
ncbi:MAG TPA: zinc-binding dehydrogenase, partial [Cyclobacteriaceae bacterium]|nr:zinc-binding dehydrogenase [Cyclobacteriaceae bacterium]